MTPPRLLGAVLAGGESRRFGRDKSAERVAGKPLVVRAAETLSEVFPQVVVVSSGPEVAERWTYVPDLRAGKGPLAGIETALQTAADRDLDGVFVLACDLPLVDKDTVLAVVEGLGSAEAAAPVREGVPGIEPLCAVYLLSCLEAVREALDRGELAAHGLLEVVDGATVRLPETVFLNVNTPSDRDRASSALEPPVP